MADDPSAVLDAVDHETWRAAGDLTRVHRRRMGERIAEIMHQRELSEASVAEFVGVAQASVSRWIHGTMLSSALQFSRLAKSLGVTQNFLMFPSKDDKERIAALTPAVAPGVFVPARAAADPLSASAAVLSDEDVATLAKEAANFIASHREDIARGVISEEDVRWISTMTPAIAPGVFMSQAEAAAFYRKEAAVAEKRGQAKKAAAQRKLQRKARREEAAVTAVARREAKNARLKQAALQRHAREREARAVALRRSTYCKVCSEPSDGRPVCLDCLRRAANSLMAEYQDPRNIPEG